MSFIINFSYFYSSHFTIFFENTSPKTIKTVQSYYFFFILPNFQAKKMFYNIIYAILAVNSHLALIL